MRTIGIVPAYRGTLVELTESEYRALRNLHLAVSNEPEPEKYDCEALDSKRVFELIDMLADAIKHDKLSEQYVKEIIGTVTRPVKSVAELNLEAWQAQHKDFISQMPVTKGEEPLPGYQPIRST